MAELLLVAAVFEVCRRRPVTGFRQKKITAPLMSAAISEEINIWKYICLYQSNNILSTISLTEILLVSILIVFRA